MITYLLDTLVNSIKTSLINKLGLDPSTEVDLDDFPQLIDDIPILDSVEELTVTQNGTYTGTEGVTYNPVNVNLPLGSKSVTANGTYSASDDSLQGYSEVTVDIDDTDLYRDTTDSTYESVKTLSNCGAFPMLSLKVGIEPQQDLHGYDNPWVGGANVNKFPNALSGTQTSNGITVVSDGKGTYTISGTAEANATITFDLVDDFTFPISVAQGGGGVVYLGNDFVSTNSQLGIYFYYNNTQVNYFTFTDYNRVSNSYSNNLGGQTINKINFYIPNGVSINGKCSLMCVNNSSTTEPFSPYSNICPISGWDEANVTVADDVENPTVSNTYTIDLDGTRYGGTLDVVSGVLVVTDGYIASYNGETLPSTWISDRDVYAEGSTPTTGAEVCYKLATPLTIQLTPTQVKSLLGTNNVWADTGDVGDVRYFKKVEL